ncbi:hypothetical protein J7K70_00035, partial [bacterium]|nr:hypothetical protein [bacterium]
MKIKLAALMLALVLLVLGIAVLPSVSAESLNSARFLKIVSHVNYETVNPNENLLIVIQTDSRIGFIEWYFDYVHSESYHRIPFVPTESGYFAFMIPKAVLKAHRGIHTLHIHKVVYVTRHSWASYGDTLVLQIGGTERMHVVAYRVVPAEYQYGYAVVKKDQVVIYEKAVYGVPQGKVIAQYPVEEWNFEPGYQRIGNYYIPIRRGYAGDGWYWSEKWIPTASGWVLEHNVKRILAPAKVVAFGWTRSQARRYDHFGFGYSFKLDVTVTVKGMKFEIPAAEVGTVWKKDQLNVAKVIEELERKYRSCYARDFGVPPETVKVTVDFTWTGEGGWRALFATDSREWFEKYGMIVESVLQCDEEGNFSYVPGG